MPKYDYFLRYFEEFASVLASIVRYRKEGNYRKAEDLIAKHSKELFGLQRDDIENLTKEIVKKNIIESGEELSRINMLGDLLFEYSLIKLESGYQQKAKNLLEISYILLDYADKNDSVYYPARINKLKRIHSLLNELKSQSAEK